MFSEDALIITGKVVSATSRQGDVKSLPQKKGIYTKQTKQQYIVNLKKAFRRNKWIDVKFSQIGENGEDGGCAGITQSKKDPTKFGVRLRQEWKSSTYSDEGYLFCCGNSRKTGEIPLFMCVPGSRSMSTGSGRNRMRIYPPWLDLIYNLNLFGNINADCV